MTKEIRITVRFSKSEEATLKRKMTKGDKGKISKTIRRLLKI